MTKIQSPADYLTRTKSAVEHLIHGILEYTEILKRSPGPVLVGMYEDEIERKAAMDSWVQNNQAEIVKAQQAQHDYMAEQDAMGAMCGSLLQVAATGIGRFGANQQIPPNFTPVIKTGTNPEKFCTGRIVRAVPLGLIIYAGRNQYNHLEEAELRGPSSTVMELLATEHGYGQLASGQPIRDPAYDMQNRQLDNYSANISSLIGWRAYESYEKDMKEIFGI